MKKEFLKYLISLLLGLAFGTSPAQKPTPETNWEDSLKKLGADTLRVNLLNDISQELMAKYNPKVISYIEEALVLSERLKYPAGQSIAFARKGEYFFRKGDYAQGLENYFQGLKIAKDNDFKEGIALAYSGLGLIYYNQGNFDAALEKYLASLDLRQQLGDSIGVANSYNRIGLILVEEKKYDKAAEYFQNSLRLHKKLDNPLGISVAYDNWAWTLSLQGKYDKARENFQKSLEIDHAKNYPAGVAFSYSKLGEICQKEQKYEQALDYFEKSIKLSQKIQDRNREIFVRNSIGDTYFSMKNYSEALKNYQNAYQNALKIGALDALNHAALSISKVYSEKRDFQSAYQYLLKAKETSDSLLNKEKISNLTRLTLQQEFETKEKLMETQLQNQKILQQAANERQKQTRRLLLLGIAFLFVISFSFGYAYYTKRKSNNALSEQREEILEKNEELQEQTAEIEAQRDFSDLQKLKIERQNKVLQKYHHQLEAKVKQRTAELLKAKEKAEHSNKLISAFLANMSHEVRTPLNAVIGFSSLLRFPEISQEQYEEFISLIEKNSRVLLRLIDDILDISKIEANEIELFEEEFHLDMLLNDLFQWYRGESKHLEGKNLNFELVQPGEAQSAVVVADQQRLRQSLSCLLDNAFKYTDKGSVKLGYTIEKENDKTCLHIFVQDSGIGIEKEKQELIFERFSKIQDNKDKLYRGTGLGLSIAQRLLKLHGVALKVESQTGKGSKFHFCLPQERIKTINYKAKQPEQNIFEWNDKTILVAEDEKDNFHFIKSALRSTKAKILWAKDGKQAVELFAQARKEGKNIDLVLMDIAMPEMDGIEATKKIKGITEKTPVIAQTAYTQSEERIKIKLAGCNAHLPKPFSPRQLKNTIAQFFAG